MSSKEIIINKVDDIQLYKNKRLIVNNIRLYENIIEHIKKTCTMIDYSDKYVHYKSNIIYLDMSYEHNKQIIDRFNSKSKCVYNVIDSQLNLRGYLNDTALEYFNNINNIRLKTSNIENNIQFDDNKSYPQKMHIENIEYSIPTINDKFEIYIDQEIVNWGWYYCTYKKYDDILVPCDGLISGYTLKIIKKENRLKKIKKCFITKQMNTINVSLLKNYSHDTIRCYIGWLSKKVKITQQIFDNIKDKEAEAFQYKYGNDCQIIDNKLIIAKNLIITKTGVLTNLLIKELVNISLYNFNKQFIKKNKNAYLNTIKTDSLGYIFLDKAKKYKSINLIGKPGELGKFKIEKENFYFIKETKDDYIDVDEIEHTQKNKYIDEPIITPIKETKIYSKSDIKKLIKKNKSFGLIDKGGLGKTYLINNTIIPYLKKKIKSIY